MENILFMFLFVLPVITLAQDADPGEPVLITEENIPLIYNAKISTPELPPLDCKNNFSGIQGSER